MTKQSKNTIMIQGSILAVAGIITRLIGIVYRIPMSNMLGVEGNGLYSVAFGIYNVTLTLSSYSLPLAISKLVSHYTSKNEYKNANHLVRCAAIFALIAGILASVGVYFGANILEKLYNNPGLSTPLKVVAPTVFVMAILGVLRGIFQGKQTMIPTAISQILEQIINAVVSVYAVYVLMRAYQDSTHTAAYGAAGGFLGTLMGAVTALIFLVVLLLIRRPISKEQIITDTVSVKHSNRFMLRLMLLTIIPVALSQTVYQIGYTIDDGIFSNIMGYKGINTDKIKALQGVFNSQYNLLINVPVAVASAMAASTIPSIAISVTNGKVDELMGKIRGVIKFNMIIALPSTIGLAVLSRPIIVMLFPNLSIYHDLASNLLLVGSTAVICYILSTITSGILQGVNLMRVPVIHAIISLLIHILIIIVLLMWTNLGVYALVVGNITFPLLIGLLNMRTLRVKLNYRQEIRNTLVLPLIASVIMGFAAYGGYHILYTLSSHNGLSVIGAIIASAFIYFILLLVFHCFSKDELYDLPMGLTIYRIGKLLKLYD